MSTAFQLNPCPFCGGSAHFESIGTARHSCRVQCDECGATLETGETWDSGERWNARAPKSAWLATLVQAWRDVPAAERDGLLMHWAGTEGPAVDSAIALLRALESDGTGR